MMDALERANHEHTMNKRRRQNEGESSNAQGNGCVRGTSAEGSDHSAGHKTPANGVAKAKSKSRAANFSKAKAQPKPKAQAEAKAKSTATPKGKSRAKK